MANFGFAFDQDESYKSGKPSSFWDDDDEDGHVKDNVGGSASFKSRLFDADFNMNMSSPTQTKATDQDEDLIGCWDRPSKDIDFSQFDLSPKSFALHVEKGENSNQTKLPTDFRANSENGSFVKDFGFDQDDDETGRLPVKSKIKKESNSWQNEDSDSEKFPNQVSPLRKEKSFFNIHQGGSIKGDSEVGSDCNNERERLSTRGFEEEVDINYFLSNSNVQSKPEPRKLNVNSEIDLIERKVRESPYRSESVEGLHKNGDAGKKKISETFSTGERARPFDTPRSRTKYFPETRNSPQLPSRLSESRQVGEDKTAAKRSYEMSELIGSPVKKKRSDDFDPVDRTSNSRSLNDKILLSAARKEKNLGTAAGEKIANIENNSISAASKTGKPATSKHAMGSEKDDILASIKTYECKVVRILRDQRDAIERGFEVRDKLDKIVDYFLQMGTKHLERLEIWESNINRCMKSVLEAARKFPET